MLISSSPSEKKMAGFDWSRWLDTATVSSWQWDTLPADITKVAEAYDGSTNIMTILWTGGTPGSIHTVKGYIEASDGRKEYEHFKILIKPD